MKSSAILLLSLAGTILSGMLLLHHLDASSASIVSSLCGTGESGCSEVLGGRWAVLPPADIEKAPADNDSKFGIPVAMLGLFYFSFLSIWWLFVGRSHPGQRKWHLVPTLVVLCGCLSSVGFIWLMTNEIGMWCRLCLATHAVNFALLPMMILTWPSSVDDSESLPDSGPHPTPRLVAAVVTLCAAIFVGVWSAAGNYELKQRNKVLAEELAEFHEDTDVLTWLYESQPEVALTTRDDAPKIPAQSADKATLVIFTDMQCPSCSYFDELLLKDIYPQFNGHLEIEWKYFPLSGDCSVASESAKQSLSCDAAFLTEAARIQGGMPAYIKMKAALDESRTETWSDDEIALIARRIGLDYQRLQEDRRSAEVEKRISDDHAEGDRLGIEGTPTVFLNGRRLEQSWVHIPVFWELMASRFQTGEDNSTADATLASTSTSHTHRHGNETEGSISPDDSDDRTETLELHERANEFAATLISAHDTNADGILQQDELSDLPDGLAKYDQNDDSEITEAEISMRFVQLYSGFKRRKQQREEDERVFYERVKVGETLEIAGPTLADGDMDIAEHKNKVVLVAFWASWCHYCKEEMPRLRELYDKYHGAGLEIVGVSLDKHQDELENFITDAGVKWPQIFFPGEDGAPARNLVANQYGVTRIPTMILIDRSGRVAHVKPRGPLLDGLIADLIAQSPGSEVKDALSRE